MYTYYGIDLLPVSPGWWWGRGYSRESASLVNCARNIWNASRAGQILFLPTTAESTRPPHTRRRANPCSTSSLDGFKLSLTVYCGKVCIMGYLFRRCVSRKITPSVLPSVHGFGSHRPSILAFYSIYGFEGFIRLSKRCHAPSDLENSFHRTTVLCP
jgi:hypothetical protein